jgi:hypothetical protein
MVEEKPLFIEVVVGYMLKVMKSGRDITSFQSEFATIRHGNYDEFIELIGEPKPFMVGWKDGVTSREDEISQRTYCDFAGLALAGPSLKEFFKKCATEYGAVTDTEIPNEIYMNMVLFEVGLRMHANNNHLLGERENLNEVINKLSAFKDLSSTDKETLHQGRRFINDVKHHNEPDYRRKFSTWSEGISAFQGAFQVLKSHQFVVGSV